MSKTVTVRSATVHGYEYQAKTYFESAHSKKNSALNRRNFICILEGFDDAGQECWGAAEGTPRGISGDSGDAEIRMAFLEAALELAHKQKLEVSSPKASIASIRQFLDKLSALAKEIGGEVSKKPFRGSIAGFETAFLDLASRYHGLGISELLGRKRDSVEISTTSISLSTDPAKREENSRKIASKYPGWRMKADGRDVDAVINQISRLEAIGGADKFIWLDFNQTCSASGAQKIIARLGTLFDKGDIGPCKIIFEQPTRAHDLATLADLHRQATAISRDGLQLVIMADESVSDVGDWGRLQALGGVGAVNIKVQKAGGLVPSMDLADRISEDDRSVEIYVGNMLNYSDLTRWQLMEFCKALPRQDYFTSGPGRVSLGLARQRVTYATGAVLKNMEPVTRLDEYIDFDALKQASIFTRTSEMTTVPTSPGRHVPASTSKAAFNPAVMTSGNPELGEIPRYWGRNVFSNALFEESALKRGLNTVRSSGNLFFAEDRNHGKMSVFAQTPMETSPKEQLYCRSKSLGKFIFERSGINTPLGKPFYSTQRSAALAYGEKTGFPLVLKPDVGGGGHGVILGIASKQELTKHFDAAVAAGTKRMLIEKELLGSDHRFLVLKGQTVAVWRRIPAHVVGNGTDTVSQLVEAKNREKAFTFSRLKLTDDSIAFLAQQGVTPDTVLEKGRKASLNNKENLTQGGDAIQMRDGVHTSYYAIAQRIAASFPNYVHYAVDLMLEDCTAPATDSNWAVLEINSRPDILGGQYPDEGEAVPLSNIIFDGYAADHLTYDAPTEEERTVELRLHSRLSANQFDKVLEAIAAIVPLEISGREDVSPEYHLATVRGHPRHLAMVSTYMFHPRVERDHHILEVIQK